METIYTPGLEPNTARIWFYYLVARVFGITFAIKLMEGVEKRAQSYDKALVGKIPEIQDDSYK